MLQPHGRKTNLFCSQTAKNWSRLHAGQADDDLYELAQYIKTNGKSEITEKHISSRALGIQPFSTATENAFLENLTHALENIWLSQSEVCDPQRSCHIAGVSGQHDI